MRYLTPILLALLLFIPLSLHPPMLQAGEPTGKIGPMNPTMFKCVSRDGKALIQPDPFRKPLTRVFVRGGEEFELDRLQEILANEPDARESICTSDAEFDFGFDTKDAEQFNAYLEELKRECDDFPNASIVPITDTRIEGFVYEFHPKDPDNLQGTEWIGVPSRSVMVRAKGITFEIFWGTDDNGFFYFQNLGAGPILLNLQLPPDAHMLNPNVFIDSNGLDETQRAIMGFYRGNFKPELTQLVTPSGVPLPTVGLGDIQELSQCGHPDLPSVVSNYEPPAALRDTPAIPDVGGVLPPESSRPIFIFALVLLILLPAAGLFRVRYKSNKR
jgi:hypothetical protein